MAHSTNIAPGHLDPPDDHETWDVARAYLAHQPPLPAGLITYEAFLDWLDEDTLAEWVDGTVVMLFPASLRHQEIALFLTILVSTYADVHDLGEVILAQFQMKLTWSGREPDLIFVAKAHMDRIKNTFVAGPADLVIEVLSPESATRDRTTKYAEYSVAGIPEYWLIDPMAEEATFYQLDATGRAYQEIAPDADGVYHSQALPGFWLRPEWLWQQPRPKKTMVLAEILKT
jgi:Uma2 family endonuclease